MTGSKTVTGPGGPEMRAAGERSALGSGEKPTRPIVAEEVISARGEMFTGEKPGARASLTVLSSAPVNETRSTSWQTRVIRA